MPRTAWLEIDLDALDANFAAIRAAAGPGTTVHPVVKADAYGHGMVPVARALRAAGAAGLCVATWDEAEAIRAAGIGGSLLVLFPVPAEVVPEAARLGVSLAIGGDTGLDRLLAAAASLDGPEVAVHLEVETGLGRGGLPADDVEGAVARLRAAPGVRLEGVWSHLQAAEDEGRTADQLRRFGEARAAASGQPHVDAAAVTFHVAASGGLMTGVDRLGAIRPGLTVYGLEPDELLLDPRHEASLRGLPLLPVMALRARPVRVADLPAGWGISYGPTWTTPRPSRIATLPLGYGDGWPRALSNRAEALVRGVRVPIVGNVAMDAVMADVTDVPGPPVDIDDEFTLLGRQEGEMITAHDLARTRNTNSWEVVTTMARRLPRVYHAAAGPVGIRTLADAEGAWLESNSGTATSATSRSMRS